METLAVVLEGPEHLSLRALELVEPTADDVVMEVDWSGVSAGTERLLWTGRMPPFPGMGYPLVPGYEAVGRVVEAGEKCRDLLGRTAFAPGSKGFREARGLFGGAARRLVVRGDRITPTPDGLEDQAALLALAGTAQHALSLAATPPDLIVGHGALGVLLARLTLAAGAPAPTVWETNPMRRGAAGYAVVDPEADDRRDYRSIIDASGAEGVLDALIARSARGAEIVLAGFYEAPISFAFPPAFLRETRLRVAAEFSREDVAAVVAHIEAGAVSLDGIISHVRPAQDAGAAYRAAFEDPACLKMVLDWRGCA